MDIPTFNIKGSYGETNFGDDLLMCVFENFLLQRFPDARLNFTGQSVIYPEKLLKNSTYRKKTQPDCEIFGGGTQFFSFREQTPRNMLETARYLWRNPSVLFNKIAGRSFQPQIPSMFLGFGLGPFSGNQKAIENAKAVLKNAHFIGVRDAVSQQYCKDWGIDCTLGADVVFSSYFHLPPQPSPLSKSGTKKIGIIVRDWDWEEKGAAYMSAILEFYKNVTDGEKIFQFVIFAPEKDKLWLNTLQNEPVLIWNPDLFSIHQFLEELNSFDAFISARYHGAIIGALLKKPVICIEVEEKLRILTEQIPEMTLWEKPFQINALKQLIADLDFNVNYSNALQSLKSKADQMLEEATIKIKHTIA